MSSGGGAGGKRQGAGRPRKQIENQGTLQGVFVDKRSTQRRNTARASTMEEARAKRQKTEQKQKEDKKKRERQMEQERQRQHQVRQAKEREKAKQQKESTRRLELLANAATIGFDPEDIARQRSEMNAGTYYGIVELCNVWYGR